MSLIASEAARDGAFDGEIREKGHQPPNNKRAALSSPLHIRTQPADPGISRLSELNQKIQPTPRAMA
jgi:hypothetical protein